MPAFPEAKFVQAGDVRLAVYEDGEGPPVVLVHGWPELAYSWKRQLPALAAAGRRAIAPDLKGFGASDAPRDKALYDIRHMTDDLARLLDALGLEAAVFCGHDWGGAIVWPMAQLHPDRVLGVIGVCTPHRPPAPVPPLELIEKRFGPNHYFLRFQPEGAPEAVFESHEDRLFDFIFQAPAPRALWPKFFPQAYDLMARFQEYDGAGAGRAVIPAEDRSVYAAAYRRSGFTGGTNLYRNINRNWEIMRDEDPVIRKPVLFIGADLDMFLPVEMAADMGALIPDLETQVIAGCGHWVSWEKPDDLNRLMIDWLDRRFPTA